jgi:hypothetical protein
MHLRGRQAHARSAGREKIAIKVNAKTTLGIRRRERKKEKEAGMVGHGAAVVPSPKKLQCSCSRERPSKFAESAHK